MHTDKVSLLLICPGTIFKATAIPGVRETKDTSTIQNSVLVWFSIAVRKHQSKKQLGK